MKTETHPKYTTEAKIKCACGHEFTTGSTKPEIEVEICYQCHPFYTGEQRIVDTEGRGRSLRLEELKLRPLPLAAKKLSKLLARRRRKRNK